MPTTPGVRRSATKFPMIVSSGVLVALWIGAGWSWLQDRPEERALLDDPWRYPMWRLFGRAPELRPLLSSSRGVFLDMFNATPARAMGIDTPEERVLIALVRAAWTASAQSNAIVRKAGLSPSQYNVLRILRHAGGEGLSRNGIGERMVTRDPDLTRILSGLMSMGAVTTHRSSVDRRRRVSAITEHGRTLVAGLDHEVREAAISSLSGLNPAQLKTLEELLMAVGRSPDG